MFEQSADSLTSLKCMNMKQAELEEKKKKSKHKQTFSGLIKFKCKSSARL